MPEEIKYRALLELLEQVKNDLMFKAKKIELKQSEASGVTVYLIEHAKLAVQRRVPNLIAAWYFVRAAALLGEQYDLGIESLETAVLREDLFKDTSA